MAQITNVKDYFTKKPGAKYILLLCGFRGKIWQTKRLVNLLLKNGYTVRAVDYTTDALTKGDPQLLIDLVDELHVEALRFKEEVKQPVLLLGISMGALASLNIIRRDKRFSQAVLITGGDIVKVAHRLQKEVWPQTYDELSEIWKSVNMYTDPKKLVHTKSVMILPIKDRYIDPDDVHKEIALQRKEGNDMQLIERHSFGHIGTIVEETILFPERILRYISMLD